MSTAFKPSDSTPVSVGNFESILRKVNPILSVNKSSGAFLQAHGQYLVPEYQSGAITTAAIAIDTLWALPHICRRNGTLGNIEVRVTVSGGVGSVFTCGLYDADQETLLPTDKLFDVGTKDGTSVVDNFFSPLTSIPMQAGRLYYVAYLCGVGAPTITAAGAGSIFPWLYGATSANGNTTRVALRTAPGGFPFATLPATLQSVINVAENGGASTPLLTISYA